MKFMNVMKYINVIEVYDRNKFVISLNNNMN